MNINFEKFPILETERLILKQIKIDDVNDLYVIISDEEVARYEYFYPVKSVDEAGKFIKRYLEEFQDEDEITWGLYLKSTNRLIGTCCMGDFVKSAMRSEIGYSVARDMWNKGFATEAISKLLEYGFENIGLNRIEATITPGNEASVRVLEKLGFTQEGIVRERDLIKGKLEDGIIMSILKREYKSI